MPTGEIVRVELLEFAIPPTGRAATDRGEGHDRGGGGDGAEDPTADQTGRDDGGDGEIGNERPDAAEDPRARPRFAVRLETADGVVGHYVTHKSPGHAVDQVATLAPTLLGEDPFDRERLWTDWKWRLRKGDRTGIGPLDIALWDLAGRALGVPIHALLGTYRHRLPVYVATPHGHAGNGLGTAAAYADFGEVLADRGLQAFKLHTYRAAGEDAHADGGGYDLARDRELVRTVGERLGDRMDLMLDLSGKYRTLGDVLAVGRDCDEHGYRWLEDPLGPASLSAHAQRVLRDRLRTPLLQCEHVRGLETHVEHAVAEATDYLRVNPELDGGITGMMKIARAAEGLGLDVECNGFGPARRQCLATIRNTSYYEITDLHPGLEVPHPPIYRGEYGDGLASIDADGTVPVPDGPGLGVEYDWPLLEANALERRTWS